MKLTRLQEITTQITDGKHGDCNNEENSGYYFVSCKDVYDGSIHYEQSRQITRDDCDDVRKRIALEPGDSVITNSGTIGRMAFATDKLETYRTAFQKSVAVVKPRKDIVEPEYLYYLLLSCVSDMARNSNGSAQKNLLLSTMREYELSFHESKDIQRRLVEIISAYDNLIENNRRQIALLEEAAQRLYKEWFVDLRFPGHDYAKTNGGIPSGWKRMKLGEYAPFKRGKVITAKQTKPGSIPVVAGGLEPAYYHAEANTSGPVVTVSGSGANAGFTRLYTCNVWASDCSYADMNTNENILFVYLSVKLLGRGFRHLQRGSAQPHVYPTHINDLDLLVPPRELLDKFNCIVTKQYKAMRVAKQSIEAAREARDRLLPKLMSGEIEVKE